MHITEQQHRIVVDVAFGLNEEYSYKGLETALIKAYMSVDVKLNYQKAVSLITMLRNNDSTGGRQETHVHSGLLLLVRQFVIASLYYRILNI